MGRTRYKFGEAGFPHFLTCTVVGWLPVFTRRETVQVLLDSWQFLQDQNRMVLLGYVVLENHIHFIASAEDLSRGVWRLSSPIRRDRSSTTSMSDASGLCSMVWRITRPAQTGPGAPTLAGGKPSENHRDRGDDESEVELHPRQSGEAGLRLRSDTLEILECPELCEAGVIGFRDNRLVIQGQRRWRRRRGASKTAFPRGAWERVQGQPGGEPGMRTHAAR